MYVRTMHFYCLVCIILGFYGLKRQFRSQFLSIKNKIKLYKTLIRPMLAYGSETLVLSKSDEALLRVFERKIFESYLWTYK